MLLFNFIRIYCIHCNRHVQHIACWMDISVRQIFWNTIYHFIYLLEIQWQFPLSPQASYLWRAPSWIPHPRPKSAFVGAVGWGIPNFTDWQPPQSGQQITVSGAATWWRHQMETFSALLTICAGNSPVMGEFPAQSPVTRSSDVFFDLRLNARLSKQRWGRWLRRHCVHYDVTVMIINGVSGCNLFTHKSSISGFNIHAINRLIQFLSNKWHTFAD